MRWLLLLSLPLCALELKPWFGDTFQPELRGGYVYQHYPTPYAGETLHSGIFSAAISPWPTWSTELEFGLTDSTQRNFFFDYGSLTFRYLLLDDISGDPVSWTVGGTLLFASKTSVRDIGTPHLGNVNLALHTAVGKEITQGCDWKWRYWAVGAIIDSFQNWPKLAGYIGIERNICNRHFLQVTLSGHMSTHGGSLPPPNRFAGYANVNSSSLDLAARYEYSIPWWGSLMFQYAYRLAAKNYPHRLHTLTLTLYYPISI